MFNDAIATKVDILSEGISFRPGFLDQYDESLQWIEKRRAYGSGDSELATHGKRVPQEILLDGKIICALNHAPTSSWKLGMESDAPFIEKEGRVIEVEFPTRPNCYGELLSNGQPLEKTVTVYGNYTLGVFTPGHCFYFNNSEECKFCSLGPARDLLSEHHMSISPALAKEAIGTAVSLDPGRYKHVLINGGNIRNYDRGFARQVRVHEAIASLDLPSSIERHLISMPPMDFRQFDDFAKLGGTLAMSLELFDPEYFERICPGKAHGYGRDRFLDAFRAAVDSIGKGNVYAGLVAGLEPLESILEGIEFFGEMGVVPAIAVFHPDAGSQMVDHPRPSVSYLTAVGAKMAEVYKKNNFRPFIEDSGRNALDTEAYLQGFGS